ncbi:MAG: hypothetical protein IJ560_02645 [Alphaproteobacteria bacterium]|nr:hypothetical protein [Alphaproteobacteria bacterium]
MKTEYGRSLIEIIGVMAIGAVMTAGAFGIYNAIRNNQKRTIAGVHLEQIAKNTKILMAARGDYRGVSVEYLAKAGAIDFIDAPMGGEKWSVDASVDGTSFSINLTELTRGECEFFTAAPPRWATHVIVNGYESGDSCFSSNTNYVSFVVE